MHSRILSLMTTSAVVLHALLGCCAHHSHAAHDHGPGDASTAVVPSGHCGHDHSHSQATPHVQDSRTGESPHGQEPCNEPDCNFVATPRGDDVRLDLSQPLWLPLTDAADASLTGNLSGVNVAAGPPGQLVVMEPLRATTQVWLL